MKMRLVVFFALFVVCKAGFHAALPEAVAQSDIFGAAPEAPVDSYGPPQAPSDSYGAPVKAPVDSYGPPTKVSAAPAPEILSAPASEPVATEIVAAAPAQSASFNFLSELTTPNLVPLAAAETSLKTAPVVQQETLSAPLPEILPINVAGLAPPITSIPPPPAIPSVPIQPPVVFPPPQSPLPVQPPVVLPPPQLPLPVQPPVILSALQAPLPIQPPVVSPPQSPLPVQPPVVIPPPQSPLPVQPPVILSALQTPLPVQPPVVSPPQSPLPVQPPVVFPPQSPLPIQPPASTPVTKVTAHEITVPRVRTAFLTQRNFPTVVPSLAPFNYAPFFFHANALPSTFFATRGILPQLSVTPQLATAEFLNLQPQTTSAAIQTSAVKAAPITVEAPSTSYGTPILETLHKKK